MKRILDQEEETITIGEQTYRYEEQSKEFQRLASHLKEIRRMINQRQKEIAALTMSRDAFRNVVLRLAGETGAESPLPSAIPETLSFEDAD